MSFAVKFMALSQLGSMSGLDVIFRIGIEGSGERFSHDVIWRAYAYEHLIVDRPIVGRFSDTKIAGKQDIETVGGSRWRQ